MKNAQNIKCPNCDFEIDVNDILYHQIDDQIKKKYQSELTKEKEQFESQRKVLAEERKGLEQSKKEQQDHVDASVKEQLKVEKKQLQTRLKKELEEEKSEQIKALETSLNEKSEQVKEFNKAKSEIEKLKREKAEMRGAVEAEAEKRISKTLSEEREKIKKFEAEQSQLKLSEKENVINQLNTQLKEAQRKAEQGSMQLQGEVQELAIEEWLQTQFPLDTIEEIKKGARGGDCIQTVNTRARQNCGMIYFESKRTKGFQPSWIEKFKGDIQARGADIGVLVTESLPTDMKRMGTKSGIWVCTFEEFKGLCLVLRETIIRVSDVVSNQENKGDKMTMLYAFLTGNEFRMQVEGIVEGFTQMQTDLDSEKRAMQSIWKKREKQIQKVLLNTNHMYSSVKGIAGHAIQTVQLLELDGGAEEGVESSNEMDQDQLF
ncbi:MAG: hypothetical protein ACI9BD_001578 [Candidatus Marinamargulisbacteria bacterium]|jgi:hypothetical protein